MVRIAVLSDTHGYLDSKIWKYLKEVDEIWHAGDIGSIEVIDQLKSIKPLRAVYGNIDDSKIRTEFKEDYYFQIEQKKVLITHIAGRPYRYAKTLIPKLEKYTPDILVCGHSHTLLVQFDKKWNVLWLNPGACGYKGFHLMKTLLRFKIDGGKVIDMEAIEIGPRVGNNQII
ncbi:MAG: metallophosphoesterase family protein [Flavobacteriia bacterium]|nr:metallophosphoesterase family protein [Flavobacteriia bacterium]